MLARGVGRPRGFRRHAGEADRRGNRPLRLDRHAPGAPQEVRNEATIRIAGWLKGTPLDDTVLSEVRAGAAAVIKQYRHNPSRNALRLSGAAGLLAPWRAPNAAIIQEADD